MKPTAIVVEDEYKIREVFVNLLETFCKELEIVGQAESIAEAYQLITNKKPAVVFLDIEMAGSNAFDLLSRFETIDFEIVFVTSYSHYALKAIKMSALDYLLKPVTIEELQDVTKKIVARIGLKQDIQQYIILRENLSQTETNNTIVINTKDKLEYVKISEISYLEADRNYTSIYLKNGKSFFTAKTLKEYESIVCEQSDFFIRIHKSYIVNMKQIKHIERGDNFSVVLLNGKALEVSRRKRNELMEKLEQGI